MLKLRSILLLSALFLGACATTPSTTPLTFEQWGKLSVYPLNTSTYRIHYQAPSRMSHTTAEEVVLVKIAQQTIKNGFQFFKIIDTATATNQPPKETVVYPYPAFSPYGYPMPLWNDPFFNRPYIVQSEPSTFAYHVEMYKPTQQPQDAFDAQLILQHLGQKFAIQTATQ